MAISISGASNAKNSGSGSLTFSHTTDGNDLWVFVGVYNSATQVSVTFNSVTMVKINKPFGVSDFFDIFYLSAVAAATANVVVTGGTYLTACALNISGAAGIRTFNCAAGGPTTTPTMTLDTISGDTVIDMVQQDNPNQTYTQGAGQTKIYDQVDASSDQKSAMSYEVASGSSTTMSWTTLNSANWDIGAISLIPSGGGGGGGGTGGSFTFVG